MWKGGRTNTWAGTYIGLNGSEEEGRPRRRRADWIEKGLKVIVASPMDVMCV